MDARKRGHRLACHGLVGTSSRRLSTDKQSKESIPDQLRVCDRVVEREGGKTVATFTDEAETGGTADRAGYQALRAAARRKEFNAVVVEDLSRLWREQAEQWACIKEWMDLGIHIVTASGVDSRQTGFDLIAAVQGAAAELARKEIGYRVRRGKEGLARAKKHTGGRIYGYDCKNGQLTINAKEARVVRRIFEMRRDGMSARAIALQLDKERVPSPGARHNRTNNGKNRKPTDGLWRRSAIDSDWRLGRGILNRSIYAGLVVYGRTAWKRGNADSKPAICCRTSCRRGAAVEDAQSQRPNQFAQPGRTPPSRAGARSAGR